MNEPGPIPEPAADEAASALDTVAQALDALDDDDLDRAESLADSVAAETAPPVEGESETEGETPGEPD